MTPAHSAAPWEAPPDAPAQQLRGETFGHIKEVGDLVRQSRLVTLTGVGGVGKTRRPLDELEDGAWFVELALVTEAGFLAVRPSPCSSVPAEPTSTAEQRLMRFLSPKKVLLVLDNCEHLIRDVAALVVFLLGICPDVRCPRHQPRRASRAGGEVLWRVPSLRVHDDAAAVELFAERARPAQPGFTVDGGSIAAIAWSSVCVSMGGPLAIELATARLNMLLLQQISETVSACSPVGPTAVERQRTLKTMDWSYDLLSEQEQRRSVDSRCSTTGSHTKPQKSCLATCRPGTKSSICWGDWSGRRS